MDNWSTIATAVLSFLLAILGFNYKSDKKRTEDHISAAAVRQALISERLTRVETELMTEQEVRKILKEYFDPFMQSIHIMQRDVQDIKIQLARMPRRSDDE